MRSLLSLLLAACLVLGGSANVLAACAVNADCNDSEIAVCVGGRSPAVSSGITYSGTCAGGSGATEDGDGDPCIYTRCSGVDPIVISGPFTAAGCSSDGDCLSSEVCVSSAGAGACGTGFSQCVPVCFATTTSTSTSSTSTTSSSSSTSSSSTTSST